MVKRPGRTQPPAESVPVSSGRSARRATAIDLGAYAVKLATVSCDEQGRVVLEGWTSVRVDGDVGDTAAQIRALRTAVARLGGVDGMVVSTIPRQRAVVRYVTLPSVVPSEIAEIMTLEVEQHAPMPADEMEMGHQVVAERSGTESDVLMVAAARADLLRHLELLQQADLEPDVIEVAGMNSGRVFAGERHALESIAVVDIGRTQTLVSVWRQGSTRFSRSLAWGAERLQEMLDNGEGPLSLAEANENPASLAAHPGWAQWSSRLLTELRRTFTAFEHDKGGSPVRRICLAGGLGEMESVVNALRERLPYSIETALPVGETFRLARGVDPPGASLVECIGTAIRTAVQGTSGTNLLPQSVIAQRRSAHRKVFWRNCAILGFAIVLLVAGTISLQILQRHRQIQQLDAQLEEVTPRVRLVRLQKDKIDRLMANIDSEHSCFKVFHDIVSALPDDTNISSFEFTRRQAVQISGDVFTEDAVLGLGEILRGLGHFKLVNQGPWKVKTIPGTSVKGVEYSFTCELVSKPVKEPRKTTRRGSGTAGR